MGLFVNPDNSGFQAALNAKIYVDKTGLINYTNSVLESTDALICNSRPRRFGKSMTADMTVHKSKGLEYDTVILPAMNHSLVPGKRTTILSGAQKVAWYYKRNDRSFMQSAWFETLWKDAVQKGVEEETRMLYVAMTRAVNKLILLVNPWDSYESWSSLIRRVGLTNE